MFIYTVCVCCSVVAVCCYFVSLAVWLLFSIFYPQSLLPHYRDLTSFAMILHESCESSRGSLLSCPNLSDREKSNNLPPVLLIPGMLVTRRWPDPCSALASADSNPPVLKHCGPRYIIWGHEQVHQSPSKWAVQEAASCFFAYCHSSVFDRLNCSNKI